MVIIWRSTHRVRPLTCFSFHDVNLSYMNFSFLRGERDHLLVRLIIRLNTVNFASTRCTSSVFIGQSLFVTLQLFILFLFFEPSIFLLAPLFSIVASPSSFYSCINRSANRTTLEWNQHRQSSFHRPSEHFAETYRCRTREILNWKYLLSPPRQYKVKNKTVVAREKIKSSGSLSLSPSALQTQRQLSGWRLLSGRRQY